MPNLTPISDPADPRLAPYVSIKERDLTGRADGRFIVEGKVTLTTLIQSSRFEIESLLLGNSRTEPLADILGHLRPGIPVYCVPQAVMDEVAGFSIHRGVLACAHKGNALNLQALIGSKANPSTVLILDNISNHDNVGAAFRNAAAFGVDAVLLDDQTCDPLYRKAIRVSAGASLWLPFVQATSCADLITALKANDYEVWAMTPRPSALPLHKQIVPDRLAVILGSEGNGLPESILEAARPVRIPMFDGFDSINLATAGAIALSHVFNARQMS